jgi:hypothetical protein
MQRLRGALEMRLTCDRLAHHLRAAAAQYHDDGMVIRAQMANPDSTASREALQSLLDQFEEQWAEVSELATMLECDGPALLRFA